MNHKRPLSSFEDESSGMEDGDHIDYCVDCGERDWVLYAKFVFSYGKWRCAGCHKRNQTYQNPPQHPWCPRCNRQYTNMEMPVDFIYHHDSWCCAKCHKEVLAEEERRDLYAPITIDISDVSDSETELKPAKTVSYHGSQTPWDKYDTLDRDGASDVGTLPISEITLPKRAVNPIVELDGEEFELLDPFVTPVKRKGPTPLREDEIFSDDAEEGDSASNPVTPVSPKRGSCCTRWCITYNTPVNGPIIPFDDWCKKFVEDADKNWKFFVGQEEIAPSTGKLHYQCYGELYTKKRLGAVKKILGVDTLHLECSRLPRAAQVRYCTKLDTRKPGSVPFQWFDDTTTRGRGGLREIDLVATRVLHEGISVEMIEEHSGIFARYGKNLKGLAHDTRLIKAKAARQQYWKEQYRKKLAGEAVDGQKSRECFLYFGPTGCRKTTNVKMTACGELGLELFNKPGRTKWFDGYTGEEAIFLDEFNGAGLGIEDTNELINHDDTYQGEIKGGAVTITASHLFFASNRHPSDWWKNEAGTDTLHWPEPRYQAVCRRFKKVFWWNDYKGEDGLHQLTILENPAVFPGVDELDQARKVKAWNEFWRWKHAPAEQGYSFVPNEEKYFTLYRREDIL